MGSLVVFTGEDHTEEKTVPLRWSTLIRVEIHQQVEA